MKRRQENFSMADRSPTKNPQLKKAVSLRELDQSDLRGVLNVGYNEIRGGTLSEVNESGAFMVSNRDFANKTEELHYMEELDLAPWYHGCISRARAEDLLDDSVPEGTFIVRSGIKDGEFYVSAKGPEGGPKFCHLEVDRYESGFIAVCGPLAEAKQFNTFQELIDYLRANPTHLQYPDHFVTFKEFLNRSSDA